MGGSRALTIVLATVLGLAAALVAPAETAPPPAQPQPQPAKAKARPTAAEVPPVDYLKAGAMLFNKGDVALAKKYFDAAEQFRPQLSENEQIVLDVYQEEVEKYDRRLSAPRTDPAVAPASMTAQTPAATLLPRGPAPAATAQPNLAGPSPSIRPIVPSRFDTTDPKPRARWMLHEAREMIRLGHFDEAARKLADAEALNSKWGRLEDSPAKVAKLLEKARAKAPQGAAAAPPTARPLGLHAIELGPAQP